MAKSKTKQNKADPSSNTEENDEVSTAQDNELETAASEEEEQQQIEETKAEQAAEEPTTEEEAGEDVAITDDMVKTMEAALFAAGETLSASRLQQLFPEDNKPKIKEIKVKLKELSEDYQGRGVELVEVASGFRFQVSSNYADNIKCLWEKRPQRYSRAFLETLALIVYRQPITRGEIEEVRGVTISSNIIKLLMEREWIKIIGHRDVPGKPALLGTTKQFLDDFNLKNLNQLPPLPEVTNLEQMDAELQQQADLPAIESEREFQVKNTALESEEGQEKETELTEPTDTETATPVDQTTDESLNEEPNLIEEEETTSIEQEASADDTSELELEAEPA